MNLITCRKEHLLARCLQRGYTLEEVRDCIVKEDGDQLTVDTMHPAYPRHNKINDVNFANIKPPTPLSPEEQDPTGPGTFLSKTLEKIGIKSSPTCSCKARARTMNEKGNDWCAENVPLIVSWLREEAEKRKLPFLDIAGTLLVKRAISLSRAAKKKQAKDESTATDRTDS